MTARLLVVFGLLVATSNAHADGSFDHAKTRFPLSGKHESVACESCHPPSGGTRKWAGVPLDCHGCHGDRRNHKGELGAACQLCHVVSGWKDIQHPAREHKFALVGKHDLPCASCHAAGAHLTSQMTCAGCHKPTHRGTTSSCDTCHGLDKWKPVFFTKHTYNAELLPGKHRNATCLGCHPAFRFKGTSTQCESCHRKDRPHEDIGACKTCHSPLTWKDVSPDHRNVPRPSPLPEESPAPEASTASEANPGQSSVVHEPGMFRVTSKFHHVVHERLMRERGIKPDCGSCHIERDLKKRPAMQVCERCHDGKRAFDALGTQCGRCHEAPSGVRLSVLPLPPKTFQHDAHANLVGKHNAQPNLQMNDCTSCHGVGIAWQTVEAGRDQHQPCQRCHAAEFRKVGQAICLGCHRRNDPFRPNPLRVPTELPSEWRSPDTLDLKHAPHIAAGVACEACHPSQAAVAAREPTLGHEFCGKCHLEKRSHVDKRTVADKRPQEATPVTLDQCSACHVPTFVRRGGGKRPWSTRDHFRHDKRHMVLECAACHFPENRDAAPDLAPPTMQGCATTCHDGKKAFSTISRACVRCHDR